MKPKLCTLNTLFAIASAHSHPSPVPNNPHIDLGYEIHRGHFNSTGQFFNFSNIRYAAPPLGPRRFSPPTTPLTNGTFNNGSQYNVCPNAYQGWLATAAKFLMPKAPGLGGISINVTAGYTPPNITMPPVPGTSEDCLFLDVLVPREIFEWRGGGKGAAVVVWLHGGGFTLSWKTRYGSGVGLLAASQRDGQEGIIYIALNYRLGAFGFLSGPSFTSQGGTANLGLLDQRFALEWVQTHIHKFGGDPKRVTLMGESAGGGSVMHQITAYGGRNGRVPFARAISQSGAFLPTTSIQRQEDIYHKFLGLAGVNCLEEARNLSSEELQLANAKIVAEAPYGDFIFNPVVDHTFSPDLPGRLLLTGQYDKNLSIMSGHNLDEALIFTSPFLTSTSSIKTNVIDIDFPLASANTTSYILNTLYPAEDYNSSIARADALISEAVFTCNAQFLAHAFFLPLSNSTSLSHSNSSHSSYSHSNSSHSNSTSRSYSYIFAIPLSLHGDDVAYTFYEGPCAAVKNDTLALSMQAYFVNFVRSGDPNGLNGEDGEDGEDGDELVKFDHYRDWKGEGEGEMEKEGESRVLSFGEKVEMVDDPLSRDRCRWWQHAIYT